jgi:hypothetical protein
MEMQHRCTLAFSLVLATAWGLGPADCGAQLLPPGDFNGHSFSQLGLDWVQWAVATGPGGQTLPDTFEGIKYLPANYGGGDFVADLTIEPETPLLGSPFFVFGERYDNGTEDNPADPFIDTIFEETTIRVTFDNNVLLEGTGSDLAQRRFGVTVFPEPIPYADPQPRGDINAVAGLFGTGIVTIFDDLPLGEHTIRNEFDSSVFGRSSYTYNITVVPEPTGLVVISGSALGLMSLRRILSARADHVGSRCLFRARE